jgi:CRISPR-associated protein Csh1
MQDKAITAIGRLKGDQSLKPYQNFVQNLFPAKNYDMVLVVFDYEKEEGNYTFAYSKIDSQKVSKRNYLQYAYRKGSPRGGDITFTTKFNNIDKLFSTLNNQLKKLITFCEIENLQDDLSFFRSFQTALEQYQTAVEADLKDQWEHSLGNPKIPLGFSFLFLHDEQEKYLTEFESIQKLLYQTGTAGKSEKYNVISEGHDQLCSICMQKKTVLHGFASPFKYATVDKIGLVSGFFNQKDNWKNYPICSDCALDFEIGYKYVTQKLRNSFYGNSFYLIPKVLGDSNDRALENVTKDFEELNYTYRSGEKIKSRENRLMREISNRPNQYLINLLFFDEDPKNKSIRIKLFLEEILPSRFQEIFVRASKAVEQHDIFKQAITVKKVPQDLAFSFGILKGFFQDSFYEIIQTVFLGSPLRESVVMTKIMNVIRSNYNKSQSSDSYVDPLKWSVLKGIMTILYFKELNIIPNHKNNDMEVDNTVNIPSTELDKKQPKFSEEKFEQFLKDNQGFLDDKAKIGVFAVGIYVRFLLDLQWQNMNRATPFEKKFKGYHLNAELIKKLYLDAKSKISQFARQSGFYTYQNLREKYINPYFILNEHKLRNFTDDQLSFYFVAGLELANEFKNNNQKEDNHE